MAGVSWLSTLYIANFTPSIAWFVSPSFFINLNDGLSSTISFIVVPSTVYFFEVWPSVNSSSNFNVPSVSSTLNVISFTFAYPSGANTSFNTYFPSSCSLYCSAYWYSPSIINFPAVSVVYSPISFPFLYNLNFAPDKYVVSSVPSWVVSVTLFTFASSILYVGIFVFSIFKLAVGISFSSCILFSFTAPSITSIEYVPLLFTILNFILSAK